MSTTAVHPTVFNALSPSQLHSLVGDEPASLTFLDALSLLDDVLCGFSSVVRRPRFAELADVQAHLEFVLQQRRLPGGVAANLERNRLAAEGLRGEAERIRAAGDRSPLLELTIEKFLDDLRSQYTAVARAY